MHIKTPSWQDCRSVPGLNETQYWKNYALLLKDRMTEVRFSDRNIRFDAPDVRENELVLQLACRYSKKVSWQSCAIIYAPELQGLALKLAEYTNRRLKTLSNWKEPELTQGTPNAGLVWMPFVLGAENALVAAEYLAVDAHRVADLLCDYLASQQTLRAFQLSQNDANQESRPSRTLSKSAKQSREAKTHQAPAPSVETPEIQSPLS